MTATIPAPLHVAQAAWENGATLTATLQSIAYAAAAWSLNITHNGSWDTALAAEIERVMAAAAYRIEDLWGDTYDISDGFTYEDLSLAHQVELIEDVVAFMGEHDGEFGVGRVVFEQR
ncbi:hypothetical protein ACFV0L_18985 [Streptosporangium canum]|uniref:hypothetical protein n=1 Tax=Streptosporangium canum TaxID=324952 RepID=UPI0036883875